MFDSEPAVNASLASVREQLRRQVDHWSHATERLGQFDELASPEAWRNLESYIGVSVRRELQNVIDRLKRQSALLRAAFDAAESARDLVAIRMRLLGFRNAYLRAETTLDFYADAINTRTNPRIGAMLRACDVIAHRAMSQILEPLGKRTPIVLTYLDKGLGASILKAGLRLWDGGSANPAATIKITRHNLYRPTSLIHEAGHQVAHILGWNEELGRALREGLADDQELADVWSSWASEIAADAFAFVHTGYAAVAGLHDVLAGDERYVFRFTPGDPHPICAIRVLMNIEMCRKFFGAGPWDQMATAWLEQYPFARAGKFSRGLLERSAPRLREIVDITLVRPMRAFGGRSLVAMIDPQRVSPKALADMERELGPALFTSTHWVWTEAVKIIAIYGLKSSNKFSVAGGSFIPFEQTMERLGGPKRQ